MKIHSFTYTKIEPSEGPGTDCRYHQEDLTIAEALLHPEASVRAQARKIAKDKR